MDFEIDKIKYLTLIGHIQSGKTNEEINYCHSSVNHYHLPVIFIVRNIRADQLQLRDRFKNTPVKVNCLNHLTVESATKFLESIGVLILLCNEHQLQKIQLVLRNYKGEYNLCIDEVDFSIKTKTQTSPIDTFMNNLKESANHILGATATPFAIFSSEQKLTKIKKMNPKFDYRGIDSLTVNFLGSANLSGFPRSDAENTEIIYSSFLQKERGVLLHTVVKKKKQQNALFDYLTEMYPDITFLVYNGEGIKVSCSSRPNTAFTKRKTMNAYGLLVNKYHLVDSVHYFENYSISEVLQILVDDPIHSHTHISIISGYLASRGISFVSSDYSLHLTDQYYQPSNSVHGENLLQSLRILGCYRDSAQLTLWCSENTWLSILEQNDLINTVVTQTDDSKEWLIKIKEIIVHTQPKRPLTRPRLNINIRRGKFYF
jgi:hypothetical protein